MKKVIFKNIEFLLTWTRLGKYVYVYLSRRNTKCAHINVAEFGKVRKYEIYIFAEPFYWFCLTPCGKEDIWRSLLYYCFSREMDILYSTSHSNQWSLPKHWKQSRILNTLKAKLSTIEEGVYDLKTALVSVFYKEFAQGSWPYFCHNQIFLFHGWFWAGIKGPRI